LISQNLSIKKHSFLKFLVCLRNKYKTGTSLILAKPLVGVGVGNLGAGRKNKKNPLYLLGGRKLSLAGRL
jgi:hypothetical protein